MEEKPNFYSITPAFVRYNNNLKPNEKLLYGEITALCNKTGVCWASNSYFASLYDVSSETVSRWISNLEKQGHIRTNVIYQTGTKRILRREISILINSSIGIDKKINTPIDKKINTPIDKKIKENNTSINTTRVNNTKDIDKLSSSDEPDDAPVPYNEVVSFLNEKANRKFKSTTPKTKRFIKARFNEGFNLEDFKKVIEVKVHQWNNDPKMTKYIRPETLFGTKFESYLNEYELQGGQSNGRYKDLW